MSLVVCAHPDALVSPRSDETPPQKSLGSSLGSAPASAPTEAVLESEAQRRSSAVHEACDGVSIVPTEGRDEVLDILRRMRDLAGVSPAPPAGPSAQMDEFVSLRSEISRISSVTEFNGLFLSTASRVLEVGDPTLDRGTGGATGLDTVRGCLNAALENAHSFLQSVTAPVNEPPAAEVAELARFQIHQQVGVAAWVQARNVSQSVISLLG